MSAVAPAPLNETTSSSPSKYLTGVLSSPPVVTLTAYIPTSSVGAVIGRRGTNVEELQRRAAQSATTRQPVRVSVVGHDLKNNSVATPPNMGTAAGGGSSLSPSSPGFVPTAENPAGPPNSSSLVPFTYSPLDFSDPAWTPVVIRADVEAAIAAGKGLLDACNGQLDEVILDIPLPRHRHATVVGKHGMTVARLSADHNVRIMVPHKESRHDVVQLEGGLENVQKCLTDLLQVASRMVKRDDSAVSTTLTLTVPTPPSQTKIRNLARKTDCSIKKKKTEENGKSQWNLYVTGKSAENVSAAIGILRKWREEQQQGATSDGGNSGGVPSPRKGNSKPGPRNRNKGTTKRGGKNGPHKTPTSENATS